MKKQSFTKLLVVAIACLSTFLGTAQTSDHKLAFGVHFGQREYHGDLGFYSILNDQVFHPTAGISAHYYVSPSFDGMLNANWGQIGYLSKSGIYQGYQFGGHIADYFVGVKYKFSNGYLLGEDTKFKPYAFMGLGGFNFLTENNFGFNLNNDVFGNKKAEPSYKFNWPMGLGCDYPLNGMFTLYGQITYNYTMSDAWDGVQKVNKWSDNDQFIYYAAGIKYVFGGSAGSTGGSKKIAKDDDADGVANKLDKCPNTRPGYKVDEFGCDMDSDGDGIVDNEDQCPNDSGLVDFKGCPDKDGDSIKDMDDACPDKAGIAAFKGCPDSDGDGVQDSEDKCVDKVGTVANKGCPDTDGDGVIDELDKCPAVAGLVTNNGCPEIKAEVAKKVAVAAKGVFFESGKDVIKKESFDDLNMLVEILKAEPDLKVTIEGHTDNVGDATKNMTLSQARTESVKKYMIARGIAAERISAIGYGSTQPIADNTTPQGKAKNRRVEFKLAY